MARELTTVDEVVDALGGTGAVSNALGIVPSAVSNWRAQGDIPPTWHFRLYRLAKRLGLTINERVFGIAEDEEESAA